MVLTTILTADRVSGMTGTEAVEAWLKATGSTQTQLAAMAGCTRQAISWVLCNREAFGKKTALGINRATGIPLETLMSSGRA